MDTSGLRSPESKNSLLLTLLIVNAFVAYFVGLLLFVCKWFPYGFLLIRMRDWLYRFF
jgi:hypothetical protein